MRFKPRYVASVSVFSFSVGGVGLVGGEDEGGVGLISNSTKPSLKERVSFSCKILSAYMVSSHFTEDLDELKSQTNTWIVNMCLSRCLTIAVLSLHNFVREHCSVNEPVGL